MKIISTNQTWRLSPLMLYIYILETVNAKNKPYMEKLIKHIEIINPQILILLGSTALNTIIDNKIVISKMRGKWMEKKIGRCKTSVIISFHPAFLMRQPEQKKMAWIDLKMIRKKISELKIKID